MDDARVFAHVRTFKRTLHGFGLVMCTSRKAGEVILLSR